MKRILSYILASAMILTMIPHQNASAAGEIIEFKSSGFNEVDGAKQVKLRVKLKNISFNTLQFSLKYDTSRLEVSDFETNKPVTDLRDAVENIAPLYSAPKKEGWQTVASKALNKEAGTLEYSIFVNPASKGIKNGSDSEGFINADSSSGVDLFNISFRVKDGKQLTDKSIKVLDNTVPGYNAANPTGVIAYTKDGDATNFIKTFDLSAVAQEKEPEDVIQDPSKPTVPVKPGDFTDSGLDEDGNPIITDKVTLIDIENHWAKNEILRLVKKGIIKGYDGGVFKPENNLTRAEFAVIMTRVLGLETQATDSNFTDVEGHWAKSSIDAVYKAGIILGDSGKFRPNDHISRQELITIVGRAEGFKKPTNIQQFNDDSQIASWAKDFIYVAKEKAILSGYPDNTIRPNNKVTRAEMSKIVNAIVAD